MSSNDPITDVQAAHAMRQLLRWAADAVASVPAEPSEYTQDERPHDCASRAKYLRAWGELQKRGTPGVRAVGKLRLMTPTAWHSYLASPSKPTPKKCPAPPVNVIALRDVDADALAALGATPKRASR